MSLTFCLGVGGVARAEDWSDRKIQGAGDNLEPAENVNGSQLEQFVAPVVRVEDISDGIDRAYGYCTGASIGDNLFITNYHCDRPCQIIQFRGRYVGTTPETEQAVFRCSKLLAKNELLDYAVYFAEPTLPSNGSHKGTLPPLCLYRGELHPQQRVIAASHPGGRTMQLDRSEECVLSSVSVYRTDNGRDTIQHMCDTEGGSSGAPLIDYRTGYGLGLHWAGEDNSYNMAIPMPLIAADLQAKLDHSVTQHIRFCD